MTEPKDGESFFRKVARFVANPTTEWAEINSRQDDPEGDLAKVELRAMVDRKRRNDFVRKRELDMLRRIRREGLSPEQLAALGSATSQLDEGERGSELNSKIDLGVKAKIDEIEQQMVGDAFAPTQLQRQHPPGFFETSTRPVHFATTLNAEVPSAALNNLASAAEVERLRTAPPHAAARMGASMAPLSDAKPSVLPPALTPPALPPLDIPLNFDFGQPPRASAVPELVHDPELDEAVIAFANADYDSCERSLLELTRPGGLRNLHGATWLVLFDHYRATGQAAKFEALALDYVHLFGLSAPQWFSMPKLVAEAARQVRAPVGKAGNTSWSAPAVLGADAVALLQTRCQNLPMPWVLDWAPLRQLDVDACGKLRQLFRLWAGQQIDMSWRSGDQFLQLLKDLAPIGVREVDPQLWMLRLEALRLVNRPDQFDEAAIDYCVTYEISPPSWEHTLCRVRVSGAGISTHGPATTLQTELPTAFMESQVTEQAPLPTRVQLELSGQLSGDISETLRLMTADLGESAAINVICPKLIRLDFMAAGDLLNWVLSRRSENRSVTFSETHRLVAYFFAAMGINEHATIKIRQV
jgi:hypothetical protein